MSISIPTYVLVRDKGSEDTSNHTDYRSVVFKVYPEVPSLHLSSTTREETVNMMKDERPYRRHYRPRVRR